MNIQTLYNKKYKKSANGIQCVGPCYKNNTQIVHPITLSFVNDVDNAFCPIYPIQDVDNNGKKITKDIDKCINPIDIDYKNIVGEIVLPQTYFNLEKFLKIYYKIFSFDDAINWLESNQHIPIDTRIRVIDASLKIFGENIDIIDIRFIDFMIECIKQKYILVLYSKCNKYIGIKKDNIVFVNPSNNMLSDKDNSVERINYMIYIFLGKDEMTKFLVKFFKYRKSKWEQYRNIIDLIIFDLAEYMEEKIKLSIDK